jgi:hypothetical protein
MALPPVPEDYDSWNDYIETEAPALAIAQGLTLQEAKASIKLLEVAEPIRSAVGEPYYREYNVFTTWAERALLPNEGRPWKLTPPFVNPTLTIGSAVTVSSASSPFIGGGNSYLFSSSTNSYISTPGGTDWAFGTGDFTVEWFSNQPSTLAQFQRVFTVGDFPAIDVGVSIESGTFYYWSGGDSDFEYSSASAVTLNTWYHWAVVRQSGTTSIYRNGVLRGSAFSNPDNINDSVTPLIVGNTNTFATNAAFVGYITNFRVVKGLAVYTGNFTAPTSPLTAVSAANPYGGINTQAVTEGFTKLLLTP